MWNYDVPNGQVTGDIAYKYAYRKDNNHRSNNYQGRDPNRLYKFYNELMRIHMENFPDWRFGQLICNLERWLQNTKRLNDIFFIEEDEMINYIKEFVKDMKL